MKRSEIRVFVIAGILPVVWLALRAAPYLTGGFWGFLEHSSEIFRPPFGLVLCETSGKTVLVFLSAYGLGLGIFFSTRRHYRRGEEHGSAQWGDAEAVRRKCLGSNRT